jgi:ribosome maturation factor RimP
MRAAASERSGVGADLIRPNPTTGLATAASRVYITPNIAAASLDQRDPHRVYKAGREARFLIRPVDFSGAWPGGDHRRMIAAATATMTDLVATAPMDRRLAAIVSPTIEGMGFELVRLRLMGGKRMTLQIMAERASGTPGAGTMEIEDCAILSRVISAALDVDDPIERQFTLEVSSPGIDRPLTRLSDFARWEGYEARLETAEMIGGRRRFKGVLAGIEGNEVLIDIDDPAIEGPIGLRFDWLTDAKLLLTDALVAESLRARKHAFNEAEFDDIETTADSDSEDDTAHDNEGNINSPAMQKDA